MSARRGTVSFTVGGASYTARLSTNAMVAYEDLTSGETVLEALVKLDGGAPSSRRLRNLMFAAIEGDHSLEEIGDLMDAMGMEEVGRVLRETARAAFPDAIAEEGVEGNGEPTPKPRKARKANPPAT